MRRFIKNMQILRQLTPSARLPLRRLRGFPRERLIAVIKSIKFSPSRKELGTDMCIFSGLGIPLRNTYEQFPAAQQAEYLSKYFIVIDASVL